MGYTTNPFYTKNLEAYRQQMAQLGSEEQTKLNAYLVYIGLLKSGPKNKLEQAVKELQPCSPSDIYKFCETSELFKSFCKSSYFPLSDDWAAFLQEQGYIGEEVISLDKSIRHTVLDQYVGSYLFSDYLDKDERLDKASALLSLDLACEKNLFQALVERCKNNTDRIKKSNDDRERTIALGQIIADSKTLGNLYGTVGYFHAAMVLLDLGTFYKKQNAEGMGSISLILHAAAAESFFCGKELLNLEFEAPENEKVMKAIYQDDMAQIDKFKNGIMGENFIKSHLGSSPISLDAERKNAKRIIDKLLKAGQSAQLEKK